MLTRLLTAWHRIWMSLWALPLLMVLVAIGAAILAVHVPLSPGDNSVWFLYSGSAEEAPPFLTSLVTAMITMATLVISITMVVLTLAAQQLGPRLIRSFMADRRTQATLGLFVATVVYLLLVLRAAYGNVENVPNLAVSGGTLLVLLCLVALLGAVLLTFVLQMAVIYVPFLQNLFRTDALSLGELLLSLILSTVVFWGVEAEKWLIRRNKTEQDESNEPIQAQEG